MLGREPVAVMMDQHFPLLRGHNELGVSEGVEKSREPVFIVWIWTVQLKSVRSHQKLEVFHNLKGVVRFVDLNTGCPSLVSDIRR
jgi:hypothetical protein